MIPSEKELEILSLYLDISDAGAIAEDLGMDRAIITKSITHTARFLLKHFYFPVYQVEELTSYSSVNKRTQLFKGLLKKYYKQLSDPPVEHPLFATMTKSEFEIMLSDIVLDHMKSVLFPKIKAIVMDAMYQFNVDMMALDKQRIVFMRRYQKELVQKQYSKVQYTNAKAKCSQKKVTKKSKSSTTK